MNESVDIIVWFDLVCVGDCVVLDWVLILLY